LAPYEVFIVELPRDKQAESLRLKPKIAVEPEIFFAGSLGEAEGLAALKVPNHLQEMGNFQIYIRPWQR